MRIAAIPSMHTKQWLSKQGTWPNNGLLGCGDMTVWFYFWRHEYEVVGSSKRYILYLGKQAESYKVMIYAPPCLEMTVAEGVDDRKASPLRESAGAHEKEILESNQRRCIYYYEASTRITGRQHETRHYDTDLPSRAVTNRLSGVPVTHDDTARLQWLKLFCYQIKSKGC